MLLVPLIKQVRYIAPADFNLLKVILSLCSVFLSQYKCALCYTVILKINACLKLVTLTHV